MEHCEIEIKALPKEKWKGVPIPIVTRSDSYYDLEMSLLDKNGCTVALVRKPAEKEIIHTPEEYDFPDSLYQDHWEKAEAYGVIGLDGALLACIEVCPEEWSNRLIITELWVSESLRRKGIGKRLMDKAKETALRHAGTEPKSVFTGIFPPILRRPRSTYASMPSFGFLVLTKICSVKTALHLTANEFEVIFVS